MRGINVGGQKKIKMAELRTVYEGLGFRQVQSYIQSGNLVFTSQHSIAELEDQIRKAIFNHWGFEVSVMVRQSEQWLNYQAANPFTGADVDTKRLFLTLLSETPKPELVEKLNTFEFPNEYFQVIGDAIYLHCPNGYGRTKLDNNFFERQLGLSATTRNWRTVGKLAELLTATTP